MSFPNSPTNGQTAVFNGITYTYSTSTTAWTRVSGTVTTTNFLSVTNTTSSTSTTTGALTVAGGVGIGGALNVGATSYIAGAQIITTATISNYASNNSTGTTSTFLISSTASSISTTTGALVVSGGVGIGGSLNVGGTIVGGGVRSTTTSTAPSNPTVGDIWYDTVNDVMYRYTFDSSSTYWLDFTSDSVTNVNTNGTITQSLIPTVNGAFDLGSATNRFRTLYVTSSTIDLGGVLISAVNGALQVGGSSVFTGTSSTQAVKTTNIVEPVNVIGSAPASTTTFYVSAGSVQYYTSNASSSITLNVAWSAGTSLNTALAIGDAVTIAFLMTNGSTPYYETQLQIDGTNVSPKWQGGTAPSSGNASGIDVYTYTIIKTANATYTVLASQTQFK